MLKIYKPQPGSPGSDFWVVMKFPSELCYRLINSVDSKEYYSQEADRMKVSMWTKSDRVDMASNEEL